VRDEAHRFAITYHRQLRGKKMTVSVLDGVPGLGPGRKQRLLREVGSVKKLGGVGPGQPFYDPSAFAAVTRVGYGNVGRNTLLGPGTVNMDFSLFRSFNVTERLNLQFRADAANFFNSPHFNNPNGDFTSGAFLTITSAKDDERQFRFGLRLSF